MTYLPDLSPDLQVIGIMDPGVPNQERIVCRPRRRTSLAGHCVVLGIDNPEGGAFPIHDQVFWFPEMIVEPPAWIFLYTGKGVPRQTQMPSGEPALTFHWNRDTTLFNTPRAVAIVFRATGTEIGRQWATVPRLPGQ